MNEQVTPYKLSRETKREQVEQMFNTVSARYDLLNKVITWGMQKRWYNNVLKLVAKNNPDTILDIATGTADMAILLSKTRAKYILGVDISQGMLAIAKEKIERLNLQEQIHIEIKDAENMDMPDNFFDVTTVAYGIRNFGNLEKGLAEMLRVTKPGGITVILETSIPSNPLLRSGYRFYVKYVMPGLASLFSTDKCAYTYLSESAIKFPYGNELVEILQKTGFRKIESMPQAYGISTIYRAEK